MQARMPALARRLDSPPHAQANSEGRAPIPTPRNAAHQQRVANGLILPQGHNILIGFAQYSRGCGADKLADRHQQLVNILTRRVHGETRAVLSEKLSVPLPGGVCQMCNVH